MEGDLVYFQKEGDSQLDNNWTVCKVDQVVRGQDLKIRMVIVRYQNAKESHYPPYRPGGKEVSSTGAPN